MPDFTYWLVTASQWRHKWEQLNKTYQFTVLPKISKPIFTEWANIDENFVCKPNKEWHVKRTMKNLCALFLEKKKKWKKYWNKFNAPKGQNVITTTMRTFVHLNSHFYTWKVEISFFFCSKSQYFELFIWLNEHIFWRPYQPSD